jgi:hypothetical protein
MKKEDMLRLLTLASQQPSPLTEEETEEYDKLAEQAAEEGLYIVFDRNGHRPHLAIYIPEWDELQ